MKAKKFAKIGKKLALDSLIDGLNTFYNIPIDSFGLYNIEWSFSMGNAEVEKNCFIPFIRNYYSRWYLLWGNFCLYPFKWKNNYHRGRKTGN